MPELADARSEFMRDFYDTTWTENEQYNDKNDNKFRGADIHLTILVQMTNILCHGCDAILAIRDFTKSIICWVSVSLANMTP